MNCIAWAAIVIVSGWLAGAGFAQPPPGPPPEPMGEGPESRRPLAVWMERFEEDNPEEFARLQALRESDPAAFEQELERRLRSLRDRRMQSLMEEFPRIRELVEQLPPEEREALFRKRGRMGPPPEGRKGPRGRQDEAEKARQQEISRLARQYRQAPEEEKAGLRETLHQLLSESFDRQEAERRRHVERAEEGLLRLKEMVEFRQQNRDAIIERRLMELTEGDPMAF